ncbi:MULTISPECIES: hypothetical protein [Paraburkholderia]|uniref:hypothetical protein n=1 Tax=Paraburkholderia TaxID=1822464 RepID=UPI00224F00AC|nr:MULTISPECIES: hypothetical protein [Paraburkholderia]MCX4156178.1 hypothetical protein [Paraburkholderia aspalathi]MDN7165584.1 hypothetical protein [Paraburkholderia sp. SECH2]MDQ6394070.1 hypothetical protein [Paraburkholderia aspalathi]
MLKAIGAAAAATFVVYEVVTIGYSVLMLSIALPAEQRCEGDAMKAALQMESNPRAADSQFLGVTKTCEKSASIISALVPPGFKP